jgi:glycosyltransferase involved in cell wall biosynthesis
MTIYHVFAAERNVLMKSLTIGVAIITFNGLKYISPQLESIIKQTRSVDHIVISDDRSTDGTWEFLEKWAKHAPVRVTLLRNEPQLGLTRNFEQSITAMDEDIIFTSDQDDVWLPNKVALMVEVFEQRQDVSLIHTDAILVDSEGRDLSTTLFGELGLSDTERKAIHQGNAFAVNCRRNVITGATVAFRHKLLSLALPLPGYMYHDAWLALIAAATDGVHLLERPTIHYRQHGSNVVGIKKMSLWMKTRHLIWQIRGPRPISKLVEDNVAWRTDFQERLLALPAVSQSALCFAANNLAFYEGRGRLPDKFPSRLLIVLRSVFTGRYGKFSFIPWHDAIRDILAR